MKYPIDLQSAKHLYSKGCFKEALEIYEDLYSKNPLTSYLSGIKLCLLKIRNLPLNKEQYLRVCILSSGVIGPTLAGGIATAMTNLSVGLRRSGHRVTIFYTGHPYYGRKNLEHWQSKFKDLYDINFVPMMRSNKFYGTEQMLRSYEALLFLERNYHDVAIFHDYQGLAFYSAIAKHTGLSLEDTSVIVNGHGNLRLSYHYGCKSVKNKDEAVISEMEKVAVEKCDCFIAPSTFYINFWQGIVPRLKKFKMIHNINELDVSKRILEDIETTTSQSNKVCSSKYAITKTASKHERHSFFFYSRLERLKGLDTFIEFAETFQRSTNHSFYFYGTPVKIDGVDSEQYIKNALSGKDISFHIVLNPTLSQFVADITDANGVLLFCSLGENSPCTIVEASLSNVNFISSSIPGIRELIADDYHSTSLFQPGSVNDLTRVCSIKGSLTCSPRLKRTNIQILEQWNSALKEIQDLSVSVPKILGLGDDKISVIIPTIGRLFELRETLSAFRIQTCKAHQIIVVHDCCDEDAQVKDLCSTFDADYIHARRVFKGESCNKGAAMATGSILVFFDDDDIPAPKYLEQMSKAFALSSYDILSTFCKSFKDEEKGRKEFFHISMAIGGSVYPNLYCNFFGKGCFGIRSSAFQLIGGFTPDEILLPFVDYRFYLKAAVNHLKIGVLPRDLYYYRDCSTNSLFKESLKTEKLFKTKSLITDIITSGDRVCLNDLASHFVMNTSLPHL